MSKQSGEKSFSWINCSRNLLLLMVFLGVGFGSVPVEAQTTSDTPTTAETIAIRVEHETVPMSVFQNRVEKILEGQQRKAEQNNEPFNPKKARERIEESLKSVLLSKMILNVYAERSGATVPKSKIQQQIKRRQKMAGGRKAFLKRVERRGLTLKQYKKKIRRKLLRQIFVKQSIGKITITDTEIRKVYKDNKSRLSGFPRARARKLVRRKIRRAKENRKSKQLISRLRKKSDIEINI